MTKNELFKKILSAIPLSNAYTHAVATDPVQQFMFKVTFDNFRVNNKVISGLSVEMGFQKVSGLSVEMKAVEYHEGCTNYAKKLAGKATFPDVTLEKGCVNYEETYSDNFASVTEKGKGKLKSNASATQNVLDLVAYIASSSTARFDATISILGRDGATRVSYKLVDAFISKWEGPDLDASSDDVAMEKSTLSYDYWEYGQDDDGGATTWKPRGVVYDNNEGKSTSTQSDD